MAGHQHSENPGGTAYNIVTQKTLFIHLYNAGYNRGKRSQHGQKPR